MAETTQTIAEWAADTFGAAGYDARIVARANEEMAELLRHVTSDAPSEDVLEEIADIVIVLARVAHRNGGDIWDEVEKKMAINRNRTWKKDGTGHGYHVREKANG